MSKVDWSLAPEGATKYNLTNGYYYKGDRPDLMIYMDGGWTDSVLMQNNENFFYRPKPATWSGPQDGLPPVGTVCEFAGGTACPEDPWHPDLKEGAEVTVIAHFDDGTYPLVAFIFRATNPNIGRIQVEQARPACFRPIKTPEQLVQEQRETAIREFMDIVGTDCRVTAGKAVDAGFKREVV